MAEYQTAFATAETQALGIEGVYSIVPSNGAYARGENALRMVSRRMSSQLPPALAEMGMSAATVAGMSQDEVDLMDAAIEEVHYKRLRPLKELEELDKKLQEAEQELKDAGGYMMALASCLKRYRVSMPAVAIEFRQLTIRTDALIGSSGIPTVGNSIMSIFKKLLCIKDNTVDHAILDNLNGVILPGRPTLLLGPPASGKSSLLKVLSGRYRNGKNLRISGDLLYNGYTQDEFVVERTASYVDQHDNHIPSLSVMDTLEFAHTCQLGRYGGTFDLPAELHRAMDEAKAAGRLPPPHEQSKITDEELLKLLTETYDSGVTTLGAMRSMGILHTANTPVGDAMLRGVSGGERKRVTTAEMLVGPRRVLLLDEISTGLDSATLFAIVDLLCRLCRSFDITMLVSLLQPPPEVYFLFDDVMLMSAGHVTFHGPVAEALPFYKSIGFECPPRKDVPSFLQEVATASGQQELAGPELKAATQRKQLEAEGGKAAESVVIQWVMPPEKVVEAYWQTEAGRHMSDLLSNPFKKENCHPDALVHTRYALRPMEALMVVAKRQGQLVLKDMSLLLGRVVQATVMGLITGSLFYQLSNSLDDSRTFFGVSFLSVMFMSMGALPAIPVALSTKGVWYKHRAAKFYPAWCHAVGANVADAPVALLESLLYSIIVYFMVGYRYDAGCFFKFYLTLASFAINSAGMYRLIAWSSPDAVAANAFGGLVLLILILLSGFAIIRGSIPDYWIWAYYVSPFAWALRCIVINEFTSPSWNEPSPASPADPSHTVGVEALLTFDFYTESKWFWGGIGYLWGTTLVYIVFATFSLKFFSGARPVARVVDTEQLIKERQKAEKAREAAAAGAAAAADKTGVKGTSDGHVHVIVDSGSGKLPYTPIALVFKDLRYFVPNPSKGKKQADGSQPPDRLELLKGITGFSVPGSMTALMGGSGAGKTTLMDVIAGRKTVGEITGDILVNGHPKEQGSWARSSGYVEQMDLHTPATTVLEALMFSARLRLSGNISKAVVRAYVDTVVRMVELDDCMFTIVGIPGAGSGTGLNVDARKRLTLAVELVANPSVVFMDEPTSGLDARAASIVMRAIKNVAADGRTVMVTIHQPSIEIFEAFDNLLLLQRGGRTTYFGPLGSQSKGLVDYLMGAVPGVEALPEGYNPATWMLEVTGAAKAVRIKAVEADWPAVYSASALCASNTARADELVEKSLQDHPQPLTVSGKYASGMNTQMVALVNKFTIAYWRTPSYNFIRLAITITVALVYGSVYWKQGQTSNPATIGDVQNIMGVLYSSSSFLGMLGMNSVQPVLGFERVVYYREQAAAMYSPWVYGIVLGMVELPYLVAQVILFVGILYFMVDFLNSAAHFFYYLLLVFITLDFYVSFGSALVYVTPTQQLAQVMGAGMNFLFNLFNGFVIAYPVIPEYYKWANRGTPTTWLLYGLTADQLGGDNTPFSFPGWTESITVKQFLRKSFGFKYDFRMWCLLIVAAYVVFFRLIGIFALRYISFLKR